MATITPEKLEQLLAPVSADAPGGADIAYDPDYIELERIAQFVPEQQMGNTIIPAVEPEWRDVRIAALDLAGRSKDLRVFVHLTTSLLKTEGIPGLRDGLKVLKGTVEQYWDVIYPRLDPDDNNDPMERMNIMRVFASRDVGGAVSVMVRELRLAPLTDSRLMGRFGLKDIATALAPPAAAPADGSAPPPEKKLEMSLIEAAAKDTPLEFLQASAAAAVESADLAKGLEKAIDGQVGMGRGIDFKEFVKTLGEASTYLNRFLAMHGVGSAVDEATGETAAGGGGAVAAGGTISGEIRSRADVAKMLDKICDYYTRFEPASPIPLLLRRAQRLLNKDFWGIIMDMAPDSAGVVQTITGSSPPEQTSG